MKIQRMLRTRAALAVGVTLLSGAAVAGTAGPATAASGCNSTYISSKSFIEWRGEARIPAWSDGTYLSLNCSMQLGSSGAGVRALQTSLNECYDESLDVDGQFGPRTRDALKRAQAEEDISVDGGYGPQTRNALAWYYKPVTPMGSDECSRL
ncbi:peptidoglycan-binding protein [Streptomyces sp. NPDC096048]|uniref:peptidoglycan-binding domain-containing protein n=1 Tax=Streptomyces sp. NPDC096048 TaxID=3366072 RepID=UPI00380CD1FE